MKMARIEIIESSSGGDSKDTSIDSEVESGEATPYTLNFDTIFAGSGPNPHHNLITMNEFMAILSTSIRYDTVGFNPHNLISSIAKMASNLNNLRTLFQVMHIRYSTSNTSFKSLEKLAVDIESPTIVKVAYYMFILLKRRATHKLGEIVIKDVFPEIKTYREYIEKHECIYLTTLDVIRREGTSPTQYAILKKEKKKLKEDCEEPKPLPIIKKKREVKEDGEGKEVDEGRLPLIRSRRDSGE